ncbi:pheromone-binding protein-like [Epargyreus clarus]|uniref:pheromone-binding protein-like n=1 Tax=Epargyreus clarus TaxID=520877 RepID=UPI003C2F32EA
MARYLFIAVVLAINGISANEETMKSITSSFLKVLDQCKHELNLGDHVLSDLYHFWKEETGLAHRDTGCAIVCMSKKLELLDASGKLHHGNAQEFAVKNGAAEDVASKLVALVHGCEQQHEAIEDECLRALDVAKCFRASLHDLDWAPKMEVAVAEVLTEI